MSEPPLRNPISPTVDFERDGVQHGYLRLPYSRDDSAWGAVMIPITVVKNGAGPTALFTGGNHGDEYEGPLALSKLACNLDPARVQGRVIIIPFMNAPAVWAGTSTTSQRASALQSSRLPSPSPHRAPCRPLPHSGAGSQSGHSTGPDSGQTNPP